MPPGGHRYVGWPVTLLLLTMTLVAGVTTVVADPGEPITYRWPVAGFAAATLVLAPRHRWSVVALAIAAAAGGTHLLDGQGVALSLAFALACTAGALLSAVLLTARRGDARPGLTTQEDFLRLLVAAVLGGAVAAGLITLGVAVLTEGASLPTAFGLTYGAHSAAVLVTLPAALTLTGPGPSGRLGELVFQASAVAIVTVAVFTPGQHLPLVFLPLPLLVWGALRFDIRTVAFEVLLFSGLVTFLTARGYGPFGGAIDAGLVDGNGATGMRQAYLVCAAVLTLPLAIAVHQRLKLLRRVTADEQLFRRNFTESLIGMVLMHQRGEELVIVDTNETAARILGGERDAIVGRTLESLLVVEGRVPTSFSRVHPDNPHGWRDHAEVAARPGSRVEVAVSLLTKQAPTRIWSAQLLDVSAENDARHRLEAAEKLTSATLDTTACIILVTDREGRIVRANAATTDLTGYAASELVGRRVRDTAFEPADAGDLEAMFSWPDRSGVPPTREGDLVSKGGETLRVVWSNNVVRDESGSPTYAVLTGIDVTAERASTGMVDHLMRASFTTALVGIDTAGRVTVVNSGAQHMLGYGPDDIVGQPFTRILDPDELLARTGAGTVAEAFDQLIAQVGVDGETRPRDWTWVTRSGHHQTVSMTLSVAEDPFASQVGFLCVGRDVTDQRQGQEMLVAALEKERTAVERLRYLDEAKDEFVSTVSHELRTPVTSIVGYTEMLSDGTLVRPDPAQVPLLETIARNGQRLIVICNDLLLLSGLGADNLKWKREPVDLAETLAPVEEAIRPLVAGRDLSVTFQPPAGAVPVLGDRSQLERVLLNLLSNAVKFTDDGGIVRCRLAVDGTDAVVTVCDTGIGIPVEEQDGLFQKFFRSSTAQERAIQGTGLGLSIVAAIVSGHRGQISVESAHLAGTTFTVRIPLAP
ncbi:PAS domain S-box protein [Nocardioides sp. W7]|uniref:PAS domain S-box protein n=1 Tax=Nocardioides sp. W7 TaxID=2931390 RepID=UPI001FD5E982|nr:PAS domain S-box protein [Nocardioides sp. W7]